MDRLIKLIYNRLYRKGVNVPKSEIRQLITKDNLSPDEMDAITQKLIEKYSVSSSLVKNDESMVDDSKAALLKNDEIDSTPASISRDEALGLYKPSNSSIVDRSQAREIVYGQLEESGLDLKTSQVAAIVQKTLEQNLDFEESVAYVINQIKMLVAYQEQNANAAIDEAMADLNEFTNQSYTRRTQKFDDALTSYSRQLEVSANFTKSRRAELKGELASYFPNQNNRSD